MYEDRILSETLREKVMSAQDAARLVKDGMTIGASGFGRIGYPKAVSTVVAENKSARELTLICGASVGDELDGVLARAGLMARRYAYQTQADVREGINRGRIHFADIHLSRLPQLIRKGFLGKVDLAILECCLVKEDGSFVPTLSVGISDVLAECAGQVILELNLRHPAELAGLHDIARAGDCERTLGHPAGRAGGPSVPLDPEKIAAIVITDIPDQNPSYAAPDETSRAIASHILRFLEGEIACGMLPAKFCLQSGVGLVANAVLDGLLEGPLRGLGMYTEVIQDSVLPLLEKGVLDFASATSLCLSGEAEARFYAQYGFYRDKVVLRPQEISNSGTLIRRFELVAMNTAVEADIYGNINSTHLAGSSIFNGIGGSGDFARNAHLSVFMTPSVAKNGAVSCIVPMVTHTDNAEHDVHILVTEQGLADLRGLSPKERAASIIAHCAHPDFRPKLQAYFDGACAKTGDAHTPHDLKTVFSWND